MLARDKATKKGVVSILKGNDRNIGKYTTSSLFLQNKRCNKSYLFGNVYKPHNQVCTFISEIFLIVEADELYG